MSTSLYRTLRLAYGRTDDEPFREIPGESDGQTPARPKPEPDPNEDSFWDEDADWSDDDDDE